MPFFWEDKRVHFFRSRRSTARFYPTSPHFPLEMLTLSGRETLYRSGGPLHARDAAFSRDLSASTTTTICRSGDPLHAPLAVFSCDLSALDDAPA